jgi:hypothetical protein
MNSGCAPTTISNRRNETKNDLSRHRVLDCELGDDLRAVTF